MNQHEQTQFDKDSAKGVQIGSLVEVSNYYKRESGKFVVVDVWVDNIPYQRLTAKGFKVMDHNEYPLTKPNPKKTVNFPVSAVRLVLTAESIDKLFQAKVKSAENWRDSLLKHI